MEIEENLEVRKTFSFDASLAEKLEKEAFWSRRTMRDVLHDILENHYKDKTFDDYPTGYKRPEIGRKGRKPQ